MVSFTSTEFPETLAGTFVPQDAGVFLVTLQLLVLVETALAMTASTVFVVVKLEERAV
jgi:hypothetical protein